MWMKPPGHPRCACLIFFLPHGHRSWGQDVWQPTGSCRQGAMSSGVPRGRKPCYMFPQKCSLPSLGYILGLAPKPICLCPKCLTQFKEKTAPQMSTYEPSPSLRPKPGTSPPMPFPQTLPSPTPATFLPPPPPLLHHWHFDTGSCFPVKSSLNMDAHFSKNNCICNSPCVFQDTISGAY